MIKSIFTLSAILILTAASSQDLAEGRRYLSNERYGSAIQSFHQVLQNQPSNGEAWLELTKAYFMNKQFAKAADTLQKAPATVKEDPYYRIALGKTLLQEGKKEQAELLFYAASDMSKKKNKPFLAAIAEAHINSENGDADKAIEMLTDLIKKDKRNADLHLLLGDAYRKKANGTEAFKAYHKASEHEGYKAEAYNRMAQIFLTQKNEEVYVNYFKKSIKADSSFAPSLYSLYVYELYHDPAAAMKYYERYARHSDPSIQRTYDLTDLFYLNKKYDVAILKANELISRDKEKVQPRIYKLKAYSFAGLKDSVKALKQMQQYINKEVDSNIISKDYVTLSQLYQSQPGQDSLAADCLIKAIPLEKDSSVIYAFYKNIGDIAGDRQDFETQAKWLTKYYNGNEKASNVDLFYCGLAYYRAENFLKADSVFGAYVNKYPEQSFGYYWQAKSKALQDKDMETGLAIPTYQKLVEVLQQDTTETNYKNWMVEAYGYLAAFEANNQKDYAEAITYFGKILEIDPGNETATKYIEVLQKRKETAGKQ